MKKRLLSVLVILCMSLTLLPGTAQAFVKDKRVKLKLSNEVRYIDRVILPDYALAFYDILEEAVDGDGKKDYLIDDGYFDLSEKDISSKKPGDFIRGNLRSSSTGITVRYAAILVTSIRTDADDEKTRAYIFDCIDTVDAAFRRDHPEVFWLRGSRPHYIRYHQGGRTYYCFVLSSSSTSYTYDRRLPEFRPDGSLDILEVMAERDANVQRILRTIPAGADRFTQIFYINKWLTENNEYNTIVSDGLNKGLSSADIDRPWDSTQCVSALAGQEGGRGPECGAYAEAFKVLCDALGIPCVHVRCNQVLHSNGSKGSRHSWNYVQMEDDRWYAVDVTWNDPTSGNAGKLSGRETTKYLLIGGKTVIDSKGLEFLVSHPAENPVYADGTAFPNGPALSDSAYDSGAHLCYVGLPEKLSPGDSIAMTPVLLCGSNTDYIYSSTALPKGLTLNPNTGEITGTVTDDMDVPAVIVTATNPNDPADTACCILQLTSVN